MNIRCDYRLLFYLVLQGLSLGQHRVCLKYKDMGDTIEIICRVDRLRYTIVFENPAGEQSGNCLAPIRVVGHVLCNEKFNIIQNLTTNTTTLIIKKSELIYGEWKCYHGTSIGSDSVDIKMPDFDGPYIFAYNESPLLASSIVELTCLVYTNGTEYDTLELIWDCFTTSQPVSDYANSSMVMSTLSINVLPSYHRENCSCTAKMANFRKSTYFEFDVFEEIRPIISHGSPRSNTMWYLTGGIIGLVIIVAVLIVKSRVFQRSTGSTSRSAIYYAAPPDESNPHVYDVISPIYDLPDEDDHHEYEEVNSNITDVHGYECLNHYTDAISS